MSRTEGLPGLALFILLALSALTRSPAMLVLAAGFAVAWLVVAVTGRLALARLEVRASLAPARVVAGEAFAVTLVITNRKPLPLPWLDLRLAIPEGIVPAAARPGIAPQSVGAGFAPRGHERATFVLPLRATQRGAYGLGPLRLRAGDWLGFTHDERTFDLALSVVAYPVPLAVRDAHRPSLRALAETATKRGLVPDPLRFRGVRDHRPGDARKEIHWKISARLGALQTKLYEPATSLDAVFLVNVASYEQYWIQADPDAVETVISATAQLVRIAADAGRQVGLLTNGLDNVTHARPRSALGRGPRPIQRTLEILARLGPYAAAAPETVFLRERGRLPHGATLVVVTPALFAGLAAACVALRRAHHRVLALSVAPVDPALAAQLHAHDVRVEALIARELARGA